MQPDHSLEGNGDDHRRYAGRNAQRNPPYFFTATSLPLIDMEVESMFHDNELLRPVLA